MRRLPEAELRCGLIAGLGWGLVVALADGLPLLWQGTPWAHAGERLTALAYLAVIYGLISALLGGLVAIGSWLVGRLFMRRVAGQRAVSEHPIPGTRSTLPFVLGVLTAATLAIAWGQRLQPGPYGWAVVAVLAAAAGLAVGWVVTRCGRGRPPTRRRSVLPIAVPVLFLTALAVATALAAVRGLHRSRIARPVDVSQPAEALPNIVLITLSGIRADHLGAYGYVPATSPNLDALAARGVRFDQAITPGSWGRPSVASLLTALYPSALGYQRNADGYSSPAPDPLRTTVTEALHAAGYQTGAFLASPWLNAPGFAQGFDTFEAARDEEPFDETPMRTRVLGRLLGCRSGSAACRLYLRGRSLVVGTRLVPNQGGEAINARAARFLDVHAGEPFFLWAQYDDALPPYNLSEPLAPIVEDPLLVSPVDRLKGLEYWQLGDPFTAREQLLPRDPEGLMSLYDGEVSRVDGLVGELLRMLDDRGLSGRTIVVVVSDFGQEFGDHGRYTYGATLYDEIVRVPLIVSGPGVTAAGQSVATPVSLLDLAPTLADLADTALPAEAQGTSLVPALKGRAIDQRPVFSEALYRVPYDQRAIRSGGYKLIYHEDDGRVELYDLQGDPGEDHDLASESPSVVQVLTDQLRGWKSRMQGLELTGLPRSAPDDPAASRLW